MPKEFNDFQNDCLKTAIYHKAALEWDIPTWTYLGLKLAGEAGEVTDKLGKLIRDRKPHHLNGPEGREITRAIALELGDVLWYVSCLAHELGVPLDDVRAAVLAKLKSRQERGVISGSGDSR